MKSLSRLCIVMAALGAVGCTGSDNNSTTPIITPAPPVPTNSSTTTGGDMGDMGIIGDMDTTSDMAVVDMGPDMSGECVPESDEEFCARNLANCGALTAADNCGDERVVEDCGMCELPQLCASEAEGAPMSCTCSIGDDPTEVCAASNKLCGVLEAPCDEVFCNTFCIDQISAGKDFTCALGSGQLRCWGVNGAGQLGTGNSTAPEPEAAVMPDGVLFASVTTGKEHTCAVSTGWEAYCWGRNKNGQLGDGSTTDTKTPSAPIAQLGKGVAKLVAGDDFTCALIDEAFNAADPMATPSAPYSVRCWGSNEFGQIGNPERVMLGQNGPVPIQAKFLSGNVYDIAAGNTHACALVDAQDAASPKNRVIQCWGMNDAGQLGTLPIRTANRSGWRYADAHTELDDLLSDTPEPVLNAADLPIIGEYTSLALGSTFSCVKDTANKVSCWGAFPYEKSSGDCVNSDLDIKAKNCVIWPTPDLDDENRFPLIEQKRDNDGNPEFSTDEDTLGLPEGDLLYENIAARPAPLRYRKDDASNIVPTGALPDFEVRALSMAAATEHLCVIVEEPDSTRTNVYCMGHNVEGELGDGTQTALGRPYPLNLSAEGQSVRAQQLSIGERHSCAYVDNHTIQCWGANKGKQLGDKDFTNDRGTSPINVVLVREAE